MILAGNTELKNIINEKPILAIETSQAICGVCVYFSDKKYFEAKTYFKNIHAEKIFELVDFVLKSSGIKLPELNYIAVSNGPGSFTGLRIGLSAAKGIAFGSGLPILPVPTYEALALQISRFLSEETEFVIANKVNTEEIYYAKYRVHSDNFIFVEKLTILTKNNFLRKWNGELVFGNAIEYLNIETKIKELIIAPDASMVAKWGTQSGDKLLNYNYDLLEPNYLKDFIIQEKSNGI
jgi:tRNA threonylcarbamoyladenosine biosynthesis protein TsaB